MIAHAKPDPTCGCESCACCEMIPPIHMVITFEPCECEECRRGCEGGSDVTVTPVE